MSINHKNSHPFFPHRLSFPIQTSSKTSLSLTEPELLFMSSSKLGKKLQPARKAWKGFTSKLQKKLRKLKRSKTLKKTTQKLNITILSLLGHPQRLPPRLRRRRQAPTRPSATLRIHCHRHNHRNFASIYVNDLFEEPNSAPLKVIEPPIGKTGEKGSPTQTPEEPGSPATTAYDMKAAHGEITSDGSGSSVLDGVDQRAEQFITEFRKEMSLQRQRSFKEYQEMLERGVM